MNTPPPTSSGSIAPATPGQSHQAFDGSGEWQRWEEVTEHITSGHTLYRSSAPNYDKKHMDTAQELTPAAVKYLTVVGIDSIISFNKYAYKEDEQRLLADANIGYLHLAVEDFTAPSISQLETAFAFFTGPGHRTTLFHCGYGHGRTGTGVTGLQLCTTRGANPIESEWMARNHVETSKQMAVLRQLRDKFLEEKGGRGSSA